MKLRSRVLVGFHRLGVVLAAPCLAIAIALAVLQWRDPTGTLTMIVPEGTMAWGFGDDLDYAGKQIMDEQRKAGFNAPDGMIIVGLPLGNVRHENADWTRWLLPDGREIGIMSIDSKKSDEIAKAFLLAEKKEGRLFTDKTLPTEVAGAQVTYLNPFDQFPPTQPPWLHKQRDWMPALAALCLGLAAYVILLAMAWVIDGFVSSQNPSGTGGCQTQDTWRPRRGPAAFLLTKREIQGETCEEGNGCQPTTASAPTDAATSPHAARTPSKAHSGAARPTTRRRPSG